MTSFHDLLSGAAPSDVYLWPAAPGGVPALPGRTLARIDAPTSKAEVLTALGEALDLPEHYGHNYDALADCLRDQGATLLLWHEWGLLALADPDAFATVVEILRARAAAGDFTVLLLGAGPAVDLPRLD